MDKKNYFSNQAKAYATYRPGYPDELYQFLLQNVRRRGAAWDCGTGNGQVATALSKYFEEVYATDISEQQLNNAAKAENVVYLRCAAEQTPFAGSKFDLVTVGQAVHWFDLTRFYQEVRRTSRPGALLAVWGYALLRAESRIDEMFLAFYHNTVGPYWDEARRLVETGYRDLDFPFEEIPAPSFEIKARWSLKQFAGYLSSWSATQKYILANGRDPVPDLVRRLESVWSPDVSMNITFPVFMRLGRIAPL